MTHRLSTAVQLHTILVGLLLLPSSTAYAQKVAIWRIDALGGLSSGIVSSLESILTRELGLLAGDVVPSARTLQRQHRSARLRSCQGHDACLARIGRTLNARYIIAGNLASLGRHYVVTLKMVDCRTGRAIRRISQPLSGQRAQLIDAMRFAAYTMLAPGRVLGSLQIMADHPGAHVFVDGRTVGKTPLRSALTGLKVGSHTLKVTHPAYLDFIRKVNVRFQKTTIIKIHLVRPKINRVVLPDGPVTKDHPIPFYSKWWFWTAVSVAAVAVGATVGWAIGRSVRPQAQNVITCDDNACTRVGP